MLSAVFVSIVVGARVALASPDLASVPQSIRQTYEDGAYVELSVGEASSNAELEILVCGAAGAHSVKVSLPKARLGFAYGVPEFRFWAGADGSIGTLAFEVDCLPSDLAHIGLAEDADGECALMVEVGDDTAVASKLQIWPAGESAPRFSKLRAPIHAPVESGVCDLTMRSSGPRGEAIVFPDVVSARGRLTRR